MLRSNVVAILILCAQAHAVSGANLLRNPSFETVPSAATGEGLMPSDWFTVSGTPDTFSVGGTYGLAPSYQGNFTGMSGAQGGRWVASWSGAPEQFAQNLTTPLVPGRSYVLSAALAQSARAAVNHPGSYRVLLVNPSTLQGVVLGEFTGTAVAGVWLRQSIEFVAPATASTMTRLQFRPIATSTSGHAYPALDDLSLTEPGGSLSGNVVLDAFLGSPAGVPITIEIRNPGSTIVRETHITTLNASGGYSVATSLAGTFDVAIRGSHWLRAVGSSRTLPGSISSLLLVNGDVDGSNAVDSDDFDLLVSGFGGQGPVGDLDGVNGVDSDDFDILVARFGLLGDP
ncbi:MAG TPA: hypothetical protein PLH94_13840 [Fimbriimonadaceae bacterium]|nr:hypothetical protein [Fimbriimonadaceae bacterium]